MSIPEILLLVCVSVWVYFITRWALPWTHVTVVTASLAIRRLLRGLGHVNTRSQRPLETDPRIPAIKPNACCLGSLWRGCETLTQWLTVASLTLIKVEETQAVEQNNLVNTEQVQISGGSKKMFLQQYCRGFMHWPKPILTHRHTKLWVCTRCFVLFAEIMVYWEVGRTGKKPVNMFSPCLN